MARDMTALLTRLRQELIAAADPARAPGMQRYMKSAMPYHGVAAVPLRQICKRLLAGLSWPDSTAWQADVLGLWRGATHREERHAAIELSGVRAARAFQRIDALPLYETMIVEGAWWDYVDTIAAHRLWPLLQNDRTATAAQMRGWADDRDMWKRRSAILCQLSAKQQTDTVLLSACIAPSLGERAFFLRKAIGWALRQYARTNPQWVHAYVSEHADALSPLSRREALKHLGGAD